ncbi:OPT/YSL family transporter [Actinomadura sp. ATCC 31491]|uniref:OPT/YSL family transporter n=1 Tax=Actinomadura luzonensis TaxID=2805427 RepID=A0ABT0FUX6_9ACTN|nr:OPT/YSL family transporter [Actinomadura luzonensis]MCK2216140.1 OPT/YSL family transporter [Actinomadura luzonensis]
MARAPKRRRSAPEAAVSASGTAGPAALGAASGGVGRGPPRRALVVSLAIGAVLGTGLSALNVVLTFTVGTGFGGAIVVVLAGGAVLRLVRLLSWPALFVAYATASGGSLAVAGLDAAVGAALLRGGEPSWPALAGLALLANLAGIGAGLLLAPSVVSDASLRYPALWPVIDLMRTLTRPGGGEAAGDGGQRVLLVAAAAGALVAAAATLTGHDSVRLGPGLPSYVAVSLSPMLFGLGLRISGAAAVWVAGGAGYSVLTWGLSASSGGGEGYVEHLGSPYVVAVGAGLLLGYGVGFVVRERGCGGARSRLLGAGRRGAYEKGVERRVTGEGSASKALAVAAVAGGYGAVVVVLGVVLRDVPAGLFVAAGLPAMTLLFALLLNRVNAAIGLAPVAVLQYLAIVVLALLRVPAPVGYAVAGLVCCVSLASAYFVEAAKVAHHAPPGETPPRRVLLSCQAFGSAVGALAGVGLLYAVARSGAAGTAVLPAPVATAIAFLDDLLRGSARQAASAGAYLAAAGGLGAVLSWWPAAMPTMLGLGILLPPATSSAVVAGGVVRRLLRGRVVAGGGSLAATAGSGLILGGGLASAVLLPLRALLP